MIDGNDETFDQVDNDEALSLTDPVEGDPLPTPPEAAEDDPAAPVAAEQSPTSGYSVDITDIDQDINSHVGIYFTQEEAIEAADQYALEQHQIVRVTPVSYFRVG